MKRSMHPTFWGEVRWRVCLQLILWGLKIAPRGDDLGDLINVHLSWTGKMRDRSRSQGEG